ncbi:MAG TPA: flagellar biosynthetic protein FliO [Verrucomicrobiae bacterium]
MFDNFAGARLARRVASRAVLLAALFLGGFTTLAETAASTNLITPNLNEATMSTGLPDTGASVFRVLGALILVVGIFLGGVWLFKNWQRFTVQKGARPRLNVLEAKSIGQRQSLLVVAYQQQRMLVAATPAGITLLSHLPAEENVETAPVASTRISFADAFQQVLARKQ